MLGDIRGVIEVIKATLIKKKTNDGLVEMVKHIEIGKEYMIDPLSEQMLTGINLIKKKMWQRMMVQVVNGTWLPTELLEYEGKIRPS